MTEEIISKQPLESKTFFQRKPGFKSFMADIFSTQLFLDWYEISILNRSTQDAQGCLFEGPPVIRIKFLEGDPRVYSTNFREEFVENGFGCIESKYPEYYLESGDQAFFVASPLEKYSIDGGFLMGGSCSDVATGTFPIVNLSTDYRILMRPYLSAWFVRLIVFFIFWIFLLSSVLALLKWLKRK